MSTDKLLLRIKDFFVSLHLNLTFINSHSKPFFLGGALFFCFKLQFSFSVEYVYFFFSKSSPLFLFFFSSSALCSTDDVHFCKAHTKKKRRKKTISSFFILFLLSAKPLFVVCCCCFDLFLVFVFCFPLFCYSCLVVDVSVSPPFPFFFGGNFSVVLFID